MADEKIAPPPLGEAATISYGKDHTRGFIRPDTILDPTDSVLQMRSAGDYKIYEDILRDDQVHSTFQQRRMAVLSREWEVVPGGDSELDLAAAEDLRLTLKRISFDRVTNKMLFGVFFGFAVAECIWEQEGDKVVLRHLKVKKQRRFRFTADGHLRLLTQANSLQGEALEDRKFWTFATGAADDDEPYGLGLAHWLYWPVYFKRHGLQFWSVFIEKFSAPTPVGKHPASASLDDRQKLLEAAMAVSTDAAVVIPESMQLELLEAARSGSADQAQFYDRMDAAISKVNLSQTMTTDDGSSLAQGSVHLDVRNEVIRSDADLVCESFNAGPVKWLTEWNFPGAKLPQVWRKMPRQGELLQRAQLEKTVVEMGTAKPTLKHITEYYGGEWEAATPAPASPFGSPAFAERPRFKPRYLSPVFAEADGDATEQLAAQLEDIAGGAMDAMIDAIKETIDAATDYEDLKERLLDLSASSKMDPTVFASILQGAFATAELTGRAEVLDEVKSGAKR